MEDVHRAGGIMSILGELENGGLLNRDCPTVHAETLGDAHRPLGHHPHQQRDGPQILSALRPAASRPRLPSARNARWDELDTDREKGVIRSVEHPFSKDGGLAVLKGNLALDGCIVKTAGVDESILKFSGPAKVFESQDAAVKGILGNEVVAGDVVVIRYEGPKGGPGMQEMLYPTELSEVEGPRQGLRADHRRPLLRRHLRSLHRPRLAGSRERRHHRPRAPGRHDRDRHPEPHHQPARQRCRSWRPAAPSRRRRAGIRPSSASATSRRR